MQKNNYCVYIHRCIVNDKAYIGITSQDVNRRWRNGDGYTEKSQPAMHRAVKKYGWDNFEHIIWAENLSKKEAETWEVRLIALFKTNCSKYQNPSFGYNETDGGEGRTGSITSDETRKKISEAGKGRKHTDEVKEKISKANKGLKRTEEQKKRISESKRGENHPNWGKDRSESTKEKIAESLKKPIKNKTLGIVYDSALAIEKEFGFNHSLIARVCRGKGTSAYGYEWEYVKEVV